MVFKYNVRSYWVFDKSS